MAVRRRLSVGLALAGLIVVSPVGLAAHGDPVSKAHAPLPRPVSLCAPEHHHRFATTAVGGRENGLTGGYLAEPVGRKSRPHITARRALHNFNAVYGPTSSAEDRHTHVVFGLASDLNEGPASDNVIGYVPDVRRTRAWVVVNCVDAPAPTDYDGTAVAGHGTEIAIIADTSTPTSLSFSYIPARRTGRDPGEETGPAVNVPSPGSTPYWSTKWTLAKRLKNGVILRYQPRHCYTFDHVNTEGAGPTSISVILSSGPRGSCPKPSATSPYVELHGPLGPFGALRHERTGKARFRPIYSQ